MKMRGYFDGKFLPQYTPPLGTFLVALETPGDLAWS